MRRSRIRLAVVALVACVLLAPLWLRVTGGFVAPPVLLRNGTLLEDLSRFPPGTVEVEFALGGGEQLRGLYRAHEPGSPLVVQLAESSGSVLASSFSYDDLFWDCADAGFATLMLDYRGVGRSDGERSADHLAEDAEAMWRAALERADGDPGRVVVRAASLGTIAVATLIERGVEPAAWILVAPVRPQSVLEHFVRHERGGLLAFAAAPLFRPVARVSLEEQLARVSVPLRVLAPAKDFLLPGEEQALVRRVVESAGGEWDESRSGHYLTVGGSHRLVTEERRFLQRVFPGWPDPHAATARALGDLSWDLAHRVIADDGWSRRFGDLAARSLLAPAWIVAAATHRPGALDDQESALRRATVRVAPGSPADDAVERMRRQQLATEAAQIDALDFEHLVAWLDGSDPAGPISPELLVRWSNELRFMRVEPMVFGCPTRVSAVAELARDLESDVDLGLNTMHMYDLPGGGSRGTTMQPAETWQALMERGFTRADARRHLTRILLKSLVIPDRVVLDAATGAVRLEAFEDDAWIGVALD